MENYYPFSDEEIALLAAQNKYSSLLKEYLFHKMRFERGLYGTAVTPEHLATIKFFCEVMYEVLLALDPNRTLAEVPIIE